MSRYPQKPGKKGSLKRIQKVVNEKPAILDTQIRSAFDLRDSDDIEWLSPLKSDEYAEYRDEAFLDRLGVNLKHTPLSKFWPRRGPQWDALGRTRSGSVFLIEAKAHVEELVSSPTGATGKSLSQIQSALAQTKKYITSKSKTDWSSCFYQYTNRIAHLYLLRDLNKIPAFLVFVYFLNDTEMGGPSTEAEWRSAIRLMHKHLGIRRNRLSKYMADVFVDVKGL